MGKVKIERSGEKDMEWIKEHYPKTKDALLVDKWFGENVVYRMTQFFLRGREQELLEFARQLEEEEKANPK